jgi:hypothetical protein
MREEAPGLVFYEASDIIFRVYLWISLSAAELVRRLQRWASKMRGFRRFVQ